MFFERVNKIDKPLASFTKKERWSIQKDKIRNERGEIATNTKEIQKNTTKKPKNKRIQWTAICQQIHQPRRNGQVSRNMQFPKTESRKNRYNLQRLNKGKIERKKMNRPITSTEIETVITKLPTNKRPGPDGFHRWIPSNM